ncbi:hypothetical protein MesoLjLb_63280 [Mesorhizobium sp. L-8-3]|nr:hypothetical protein MesoLjLb_63280 [Mesorhizobium sp. L-8-3]
MGWERPNKGDVHSWGFGDPTRNSAARRGLHSTRATSPRGRIIRIDYARYLAQGIPGAELLILPDVSHSAPLKRPAQFNAELLAFLDRIFLREE